MKLHLSGPMSGRPNYNRAEFNRVAAVLRDMEHTVFNPAELDEILGYKELLKANLMWICEHAEGMVSLSGCGASKGALAETRTAQACGIPTMDSYGQQRVLA